MNQPTAGNQLRKMCKACHEAVHPQAEICPHCGVRQFSPMSKAALLLLTFFLGGIGAHKFYLGKYAQGVFYLLFCWTGIPGLIALVEFFIYVFTDEQRLQEKYTGSGKGGVAVAIVIGFVGFVFFLGILAAIAIPQFAAYRSRAVCTRVESEAHAAAASLATYYAESGENDIPSMETLSRKTGYTPAGSLEVSITGDDQVITILVRDLSGRCHKGQSFRLSMPENSAADGWQ